MIARYGARSQAQEVLAQSSFYSANDRRLHFGLGAETSADLIIRWTNGSTEAITNVVVDQLVVIQEVGNCPQAEVLRSRCAEPIRTLASAIGFSRDAVAVGGRLDILAHKLAKHHKGDA